MKRLTMCLPGLEVCDVEIGHEAKPERAVAEAELPSSRRNQ